MFLTPFLAFAAWRLLLASLIPPLPVVLATAATVFILLGSLLWMHHTDERNAGRAYVPARVQDGHFIPGHAAAP